MYNTLKNQDSYLVIAILILCDRQRHGDGDFVLRVTTRYLKDKISARLSENQPFKNLNSYFEMGYTIRVVPLKEDKETIK